MDWVLSKLAELSWKDFFANGVFFIADIVLISVLVPSILASREKRQWSPSRRALGRYAEIYFENTVSSSINYIGHWASEFDRAVNDPSYQSRWFVSPGPFGNGEALRSTFQIQSSTFRDNMLLLTPAYTSGIAEEVAEFNKLMTEFIAFISKVSLEIDETLPALKEEQARDYFTWWSAPSVHMADYLAEPIENAERSLRKLKKLCDIEIGRVDEERIERVRAECTAFGKKHFEFRKMVADLNPAFGP